MNKKIPKYDIENINMIIGENIRTLRKERDLTQEQLANDADIDRSYIGRIENGRVNVTAYMLSIIANTLNVNISDFFNQDQS